MTSPMDSTFSLASSALNSDTSLPPVLAPQTITPLILPLIMLPTPPTFTPRLSITPQLTRPTYNFMILDYVTWASGFELFLESHSLLHHLTDNPPPLHDPLYASWSQSDSIIITWMVYSIEQSIAESLTGIKPAHSVWKTLETMYANQTNISHVVEIFESLLTYKQSGLSLQAHFARLKALMMDIMWPIRQSHFHVSCLCSFK